MSYEPLTDIRSNALRGGSTTVREKPLLDFGSFSMCQNVRGRHPGFIKRKGQRTLHTIPYETNQILNVYQWSKSRIDEDHLLAQMYDGNLLDATNGAPTVTTGAFGTVVHSGSAGQEAASFNDIGDKLIYSNTIDEHQIWGGSGSYITSFIVYKGTDTIPIIPTEGEDYSVQVTDGRTSTYAVLNSLDTLANYDCLFVRAPMQIKSLTFTMEGVNTASGTTTVDYWSQSDWTTVSGLSDGTLNLSTDGTMEWTPPSDMEPKYQFGSNAWWYRISFSDALSSDVSITSITYDSDMHAITNMWDGTPQDIIEVRIYDATDDVYRLYGSTAVDFDELPPTDKVYIAATDPIQGIYIDPGAVPSTVSSGTITEMNYWTGNEWRGIVADDGGTLTDGSDGINQPGWVTFSKPTGGLQKRQFEGSVYYAYWYYFQVGATLSEDTNVGIQGMPYFDIAELGYSQCNGVWKDRAVYSFDKFAEYVYFSATNSPEILNGFDYGILEVGDGRSNKVVAMRKFHNELMVWQEEKGEAGGCVTIIEGYTPTTFGKLLVSTKIGTMNNKSVCVVDGVLTATATDEQVKTLAFFLSRYGVCACDGRTINIISDDIQNYFNTNEPECIRRGYEDKMWLNHDSSEDVIRMGLVSGDSATECNVFPVFDLIDKVWYFDVPSQILTCMAEVSAVSGNTPTVQVGGGDDGFVYQLNYGNNDVADTIDSYLQLELGGISEQILIRDYLLRCKSEETGTIYVDFMVNGKSKLRQNLTLMPDDFGSFVKRVRKTIGLEDGHISIKIGNAENSQDLYLEDLGLETLVWKRA